MGTFKKFAGGIALESIQFDPLENFGTTNYSNTLPVRPFKRAQDRALGSTWESNTLSTNSSMNIKDLASPYTNLVPFATNDLLEDYDVEDDRMNNGIGTIKSCVRTRVYNNLETKLVFSLVIGNDGTDDITISCIKFRKCVGVHAESGYRSWTLSYGYYLDEPITLKHGETKDLVLALTQS